MSMIQLWNTTAPRRCYANSGPSNTITNTTTETVFDTAYTVINPNVATLVSNSTFRISALGTISTGLISLGFRFRLRWGGLTGPILADTNGITILSSLTNAGWLMHSIVTIVSNDANGTVQGQSYGTFQSGALLAMPTVSTVAADFTQDNDIVMTAQWTTASANNQITCQSFIVDLDHP